MQIRVAVLIRARLAGFEVAGDSATNRPECPQRGEASPKRDSTQALRHKGATKDELTTKNAQIAKKKP
ncbi:MAG: hypothetical protein ABSG78_01325 [Verrucomicrobiota bacterium]|jgi:hypothetical protein